MFQFYRQPASINILKSVKDTIAYTSAEPKRMSRKNLIVFHKHNEHVPRTWTTRKLTPQVFQGHVSRKSVRLHLSSFSRDVSLGHQWGQFSCSLTTKVTMTTNAAQAPVVG